MGVYTFWGGKPAREFKSRAAACQEAKHRRNTLRRRHGCIVNILVRPHSGGFHLYRPLGGTTLCVDGKWRHRYLPGGP